MPDRFQSEVLERFTGEQALVQTCRPRKLVVIAKGRTPLKSVDLNLRFHFKLSLIAPLKLNHVMLWPSYAGAIFTVTPTR